MLHAFSRQRAIPFAAALLILCSVPPALAAGKGGKAAQKEKAGEGPPPAPGCLNAWFCYAPPTGDDAHPAISGGMIPLWAGWIAMPVIAPILTPIIFIPSDVKPPFEGRLRWRVLAWALAPLAVWGAVLAFGIVGWIPYIGWFAWFLVFLLGLATYLALWWWLVPVNVLQAWNTAIIDTYGKGGAGKAPTRKKGGKK